MRKVFLLTNVSLDGYFEDQNHDLSWAKSDFETFSQDKSQEVDTILLGRRTYEMMRSFWPTPQAAEMAPEVAEVMNERHKVVASRDPAYEPGWKNVTVVHDAVAEIRRLKQQAGKNMIMFGSNELAVSLTEAGLIDEFQIVVSPVALGAGHSLFAGLSSPVGLRFKEARPLKSGAVVLVYEPARE